MRLRIALVLLGLTLAACGESYLASTATDAGVDANVSVASNDAGFDASLDGTLSDGGALVDAATSVVAVDAFPASDAGAGPEIVSLSESVSAITQGGSFTVVATVADSRGLPNLAGGELTSAVGAVLGAFVPTSTPGTYSVTVSWAEVNAAASINLTGQTMVTNRATFYDAQGLQASQGISIELYCGSAAAPSAACAGQCVDLTSVATCGSCAASCADAGGSGSQDASCESPGVCAWGTTTSSTNPSDTCAAECASGGGTCVAAQMTPEYAASAIAETCTSSPASAGGGIPVTAIVTVIECACAPTGGVYKMQTGNCASVCAGLPGSPACDSTELSVTGSDGSALSVIDTCSAPYAVGTGTVWDGLVQADLPANEPVISPGGPIDCQCQGPAP